tara:strand:+ start:28 stop:912 length:885 start_codon:yes stop_codon:yes gene_type:complete
MINRAAFESLVMHLKTLGPFLFRPNSGNGGDAIIALACMEMFDEIGLDWEVYTSKGYENCKSVVYSGGATFPQYFALKKFIAAHEFDIESFTLMPHSFEGHEQLLANMDERYHLFAREKTTYSYLEKVTTEAKIHLSHDVAFSLDVDSLNLSESLPLFLPGQPINFDLQWFLKRFKLRRYLASNPKERLFFRTDSEASGEYDDLKRSVDLSRLIKGKMMTRKQVTGIALAFLSVIKTCNHIMTDRLHVGIAAGLCDVSCQLYPGVNFKISSIYEHSGKDLIPEVEMMEHQKLIN